MTPQEIFTKVKAHLLKQNARSMAHVTVDGDAALDCAYRGDNGTMCAVGCLIPDQLYRRSLEGWSVDKAPVFGVLVTAGVLTLQGGKSLQLLRDLQAVHDKAPINEWPDHLAVVARKFNLEDV